MLTNRTLLGCLEGPSVAYGEIGYKRPGRLSRRIIHVSYTTAPGVYLITIRRRDYASRILEVTSTWGLVPLRFPTPKPSHLWVACRPVRQTRLLNKRFILWDFVTYCVDSLFGKLSYISFLRMEMSSLITDNLFRVKGYVAVVTGGSSGIGFMIARVSLKSLCLPKLWVVILF